MVDEVGLTRCGPTCVVFCLFVQVLCVDLFGLVILQSHPAEHGQEVAHVVPCPLDLWVKINSKIVQTNLSLVTKSSTGCHPEL